MPNDLLPPNAAPQERALSLATGRDIAVPVKELWSPQTCPAGILPWLAWALSVDEWDPAWPEQTQRNTIAASIEQHRRKGTIGALRQALQRLGYEVEIDEQTGAAYTFALRLKLNAGDSAGGAVAGDAFQRAVDIALKTKNVRSELSDTKFLGEGGEAPLYSGGVPIIGAEVEIGGAVDPLPLDGLETFLLGSFWTVRMQAAYTGPIARVRRLSDNAEMNYFSVAELQAFVGAAEWQFIGFFSQGAESRYLRYQVLDDDTDFPIRNRGAFDVNGNPFLRPIFVAGSANNLACSFADIDVTNASMVMAGRVDTAQESPANQGLSVAFGSNIFGHSLSASSNSSFLFGTSKNGSAPVGVSIFADSLFNVLSGDSSGATNTLNVGSASNSAASTLSGKADRFSASFFQGSGAVASPAYFYGFAAWQQSIGLTALQSVRSSIATRLNF
jgi:phage tail P2-like protein